MKKILTLTLIIFINIIYGQNYSQINFKTLDEMINYNFGVPDKGIAIVQGKDSINDGRGGLYRFDLNYTGTYNNFDTIRPLLYRPDAVGAWIKFNIGRDTEYDNIHMDLFKLNISNTKNLADSLLNKYTKSQADNKFFIKPSGIPYTPLNPNTTITINGVTQDLTTNRTWNINKTNVTPYRGTTNSSGIYTVTFPVAYATTPNVQANIIGGTDKHGITITRSTTGFSVYAYQRIPISIPLGITTIEVLLAGVNNLSGANIEVLVTEQ